MSFFIAFISLLLSLTGGQKSNVAERELSCRRGLNRVNIDDFVFDYILFSLISGHGVELGVGLYLIVAEIGIFFVVGINFLLLEKLFLLQHQVQLVLVVLGN